MNKKILLKELENYSRLWAETTHDPDRATAIVVQMAEFLKNYLASHADDWEMWYILAQIQYSIPWEEIEEPISSLDQILTHDKNNVEALVLKAYILDSRTLLDEATSTALATCKPKNNKELALLYYAQSFYFSYDDPQICEYLLKSVTAYTEFPRPHRYLANFYYAQKMYEQACYHYKQSLKYIKEIYPPCGYIDFTYKDRTMDEIVGISMYAGDVEEMKKKLDECCALLPAKLSKF